jgi:hypothetical protein
VLEHVRKSALAGWIVHIAGVDKCGIAENRRIVPLANKQGQPIGKYLGRDSLLETLQILGLGAGKNQ